MRRGGVHVRITSHHGPREFDNTSFSTECRKPGFRLDGYLTDLAKPKPAPVEIP